MNNNLKILFVKNQFCFCRY